MKPALTDQSPIIKLCKEKAASVLHWIAESEDGIKTTFTVSKLFKQGVLRENTSSFLKLILEERFSGKGLEFELTPEELQDLLFEAFSNNMQYLLTPHSFIPEFLSFNTDSVHINITVLARIKSFVDYQYYPEMIEEWFSAAAQSISSEVRKSRLITFLYDVERSIYKYSSPEEIALYLKPLFEFIGKETLDRNLIKIFIDDKGLSLPVDDNRVEYSSQSLSQFLNDSYHDWELQLPIPEEEPIPEYSTFLQELREVGVVLPEPHPHQIETKKTLPPIEMFISEKLKRKCLEKIFHHNELEYNRAISLFDTLGDFEQAELNLNTLLQIHKVREESKVALRLLEALRLRYGISTLSTENK